MKLKSKRKMMPYLFLIPALFVIITILGIPLINLICYSFAKVDLIGNFKGWS